MSKPKIRFKGYYNDWERRKFGEIFNEYSEKHYEELEPLTIVQGQGTILRSESDRNLQYDKAGLVNYKLVNKDDFILHLRSFEGGLEVANSQGIVSPAYHIFHGTETDSRFYYPFFRSQYFINVLLKPYVYGIRDGKSIDIEGMKEILIPYPCYKEQKAMGEYFSNLDHLITLHQRQCENTKKLKKFMLQKMFPKKNQKNPEIRFAGFTNDWERRKLSEVVKEVKRTDETSDAPVMMITAENGFINQSERYSTNNAGQSLKKYILLEKGELAYNHGASKLRPFGSCFALISKGKARIPFVYHCFSSKSENAEFLSLTLNGKPVERQLRRIVSSGARMDGLLNISFEEYTAIPISLPQKAEQDRIADYFRSLDCLITLHQNKCDELKKLKKFMLQNMFI